jgi:hydrogenase expression/formation protein HypC
MCLAIPGQIVEWVDEELHIAKAQVADVRRNVNVGLLAETQDSVDIGDWVLIHVGFAMSKIDEEEARSTREFLEQLGDPYRDELEELERSGIE